ncbi:MAG: L-glutamate gamma-semialdehyde dehydrogenase [Trueperaceae bacterium]|nr:L-glutamate gamma-semialdehyde dehydrogenase [Trueperaceae bacterium]
MGRTPRRDPIRDALEARMIDNFEPYAPEPYSDFDHPQIEDGFKAELASVRSRLGTDWPLVIGGERLTTDRWLESYDPCVATRLVGRAAAAGADEIEAAMTAAHDAQARWGALDMAHRARALERLAHVMRRRKWELSAWEVFEAGKNFREAEADVAEAIDFCAYYARQAMELDDALPTYPFPGEENTTTLQPVGVGVVIPPWNFLLAILTGTTVGPVVAGNAVILKPSPNTPIIAGVFMELLDEAGFPPGVVNLLTGFDADLGDALVDHPGTRFINFTGSVATGKRIYERAAKVQPGQAFLKKTFIEMGGKDGMIVDESADLDLAADAAVSGAFAFQGQKCSAMSRLIVVDEVHDALVDRVVHRAQQLELGPAEENADVCAVINERQFDKILGYIDTGKQEGTLVLGGARGPSDGWYVQPTIFTDVAQDATIAQEEIFGPVVAVLRARDFDHALEIANATPYALTGGICSRRRDRIERARREFRTGNLYVNRKITGSLVGVQPFGGFDMSGTNAKAGGPDYVRLFMDAKTVTERF